MVIFARTLWTGLLRGTSAWANLHTSVWLPPKGEHDLALQAQMLFGALATCVFFWIQLVTASARICFPPPQMILTGMTHGYSPFMAISTHLGNAISSLISASTLAKPWMLIVMTLHVGWRLRLSGNFEVL